jgi:hypothetical protein
MRELADLEMNFNDKSNIFSSRVFAKNNIAQKHHQKKKTKFETPVSSRAKGHFWTFYATGTHWHASESYAATPDKNNVCKKYLRGGSYIRLGRVSVRVTHYH